MNNSAKAELGNRHFYWLWFVGVIAAMLLGTLWLGTWGLIAPVVGFGGAFVALLSARTLAVKAHGIRIVNPANLRSDAERQLHGMVADLAMRAGLKYVPAVGIYDSPELNSFATGASEKSALIAFTRRLLDELGPAEIRAIAAHEIAHIANGDMPAMVLLQGSITSVVVFFLAPILAFRAITPLLASDDRSGLVGPIVQGVCAVLAVVVGVTVTAIGFLMVRAYSRRRELRADSFAAHLCGPAPVLAALKTLDADDAVAPKSHLRYATFKIVGQPAFGELFSTHPSYARRVANIERNTAPEETAA